MPPVSYFFQYSTKMDGEKAPPIKKRGVRLSIPLKQPFSLLLNLL